MHFWCWFQIRQWIFKNSERVVQKVCKLTFRLHATSTTTHFDLCCLLTLRNRNKNSNNHCLLDIRLCPLVWRRISTSFKASWVFFLLFEGSFVYSTFSWPHICLSLSMYTCPRRTPGDRYRMRWYGGHRWQRHGSPKWLTYFIGSVSRRFCCKKMFRLPWHCCVA